MDYDQIGRFRVTNPQGNHQRSRHGSGICWYKGGIRHPAGLTYRTDQGIARLVEKATGRIAQEVQFDVAVTATEGTHTKGGVGIFVGAFGLGSQGESEKEKSLVSRIKFELPILLPVQRSK